MDSKHTSAKNVNFWNGFHWVWYRWICRATFGVIVCALDSIGCFSSFCEHIRLVIMEIRSLGHLMSKVIDITRKFVNFATSCCHTYIPCFGNILKKDLMLKPLVYYDQVIYKRIIEMTNLFWKSNFSMSYFGTNSLGRRMYIPRGQWYNYWTNSLWLEEEIWVILNLMKFSFLRVLLFKISCSTICGRVRVWWIDFRFYTIKKEKRNR
jgi:hypothetical protein